MDKKQFYEHLKFILHFIKKAEKITRTKLTVDIGSEPDILTNEFMRRYFELYLLLRNNPNLKLDTKYKDFIAESQYFLKGLITELNHYIGEIEDRLRTTFYDNEWEAIICKRRSAVEAVKELYRGTSFEEIYEGDDPEALEFDTEDLDDSLEIQGGKRGGLKEEDIPREIPASHWWWWSPDEPPNYIREDDE